MIYQACYEYYIFLREETILFPSSTVGFPRKWGFALPSPGEPG
jgi:hypothetical protein